MTPKRHPVRRYDKRFKARGAGKAYTFTGVPASLYNAVRDKAKRNGDSVRSLVLEALAAYAEWTPAAATVEADDNGVLPCGCMGCCEGEHMTLDAASREEPNAE